MEDTTTQEPKAEEYVEAFDEAAHEETQAPLFEPPEEEVPGEVFLTNLRWGPGKTFPRLTAALAQAAMEFDEIVKESTNPFFEKSGSGGKYADLAALIKGTRKQLGKYGLVVIQFPGNTESGAVVTTVLSHSSGEYLAGDLPLPTNRKDIQGIGSGITYARRYSYGPMLNLAAEDDDANAATASRKQHLDKLDDQMRGQERISQVQVKAFLDSAIKTGKSKEQIEQYIDKLNGYKQVEEITKREWNDAIKWAVTRQEAKQEDLTQEWAKNVDFVTLNKELRAAMKNRNVSNEKVHEYIKEKYRAESVKDLSGEDLKTVIHWVDNEGFKRS
jgi:hypothetical protein